jgi:hypothetical protein
MIAFGLPRPPPHPPTHARVCRHQGVRRRAVHPSAHACTGLPCSRKSQADAAPIRPRMHGFATSPAASRLNACHPPTHARVCQTASELRVPGPPSTHACTGLPFSRFASRCWGSIHPRMHGFATRSAPRSRSTCHPPTHARVCPRSRACRGARTPSTHACTGLPVDALSTLWRSSIHPRMHGFAVDRCAGPRAHHHPPTHARVCPFETIDQTASRMAGCVFSSGSPGKTVHA